MPFLIKQIVETYTNKEIQENIDKLTNRIDRLKSERTNIDQEINKLKKQVVEWELLNLSQIKLF
jgi:prefoldin subunit 5